MCSGGIRKRNCFKEKKRKTVCGECGLLWGEKTLAFFPWVIMKVLLWASSVSQRAFLWWPSSPLLPQVIKLREILTIQHWSHCTQFQWKMITSEHPCSYVWQIALTAIVRSLQCHFAHASVPSGDGKGFMSRLLPVKEITMLLAS